MKKAYSIDLSEISLEYFKDTLKKRELVPSRGILKENIDENFQALADGEIKNLKDLINKLKTPEKISNFTRDSGLSEEYLKILKREASSYTPKPVKLSSFPEIKPEVIKKLEDMGIRNSKHLFDKAQDNIELTEEIKELVSLSDLVRLYGVGPVFAKMIYKTGIKSVRDFTKLSGEEFIRLYEKETGKKADFSIGDISFSLELANIISLKES